MWTAIYKDDSILKELDDGKETLFKEIEQEKLKAFELAIGENVYGVHLENGRFRWNNSPIYFERSASAKYKLIYFKIHRKEIGMNNNKILNASVTYHIGWETVTENDEPTKKVIMQIHTDGTVGWDIKL